MIDIGLLEKFDQAKKELAKLGVYIKKSSYGLDPLDKVNISNRSWIIENKPWII